MSSLSKLFVLLVISTMIFGCSSSSIVVDDSFTRTDTLIYINSAGVSDTLIVTISKKGR